MKVGFVVEGHMEEGIIRHLCKTAEVRRLQINGSQFPTEKIVDRISPQIQMLRRRNVRSVVVLIDREQREKTSIEFEAEIKQSLESRINIDIPIQVVVPDRNIESWIVPFLNTNCDVCHEVNELTEGRNGKSVIKAIFKSRGKSYVETVDGVRLFKKIDPALLRTTSLSFNRFVENFTLSCWWLNDTRGTNCARL
jgi:selenocysteine-specific translation elongation factor